MVSAIAESPCCGKPFIKFLFKRMYGLEDYVDWRIPRLLLMHGHLLCVNGMILAILSFSKARRIPPSFLSIEYMGWKRCCLKDNKMPVKFWTIFDFWMDFFYFSWVSILHDAPIKFLLKRIYGLDEVVLKFHEGCLLPWPSWISERNKRSISKSLFGQIYLIKFLLLRTYGLEEDVDWRISRWLLSGWLSLISEWND